MSDYLATRQKANVDFRFEKRDQEQDSSNKENRPLHSLTPVRRHKDKTGKSFLTNPIWRNHLDPLYDTGMTWKNCWDYNRGESASSTKKNDSRFNPSTKLIILSHYNFPFLVPKPYHSRRRNDPVKEKNITGGIWASNHPLLQFTATTRPEKEIFTKLNAPGRKYFQQTIIFIIEINSYSDLSFSKSIYTVIVSLSDALCDRFSLFVVPWGLVFHLYKIREGGVGVKAQTLSS